MANTHREKELMTEWDELTATDETKFIGHKQSLVAEEGSNVNRNWKKGL